MTSSPASSSASKSKRYNIVRTDLPWHGVLSDAQRHSLLELYGDVLILPGFMRVLRHDGDGKICIPGSATTYHESKRTLGHWATKAKTEDPTAWLEVLRKAKTSVLRIRDIITGLDLAVWKRYKQLHDREQSRLRCLRYRQQLRQSAMNRADRERQAKKDDVVDALLQLPIKPVLC